MQHCFGRLTELENTAPEQILLIQCDAQGTTQATLSRAQVLTEITYAAAYLQQSGLAVGDRIALAMPPSPELLILSWAAWMSGVVTVPLDTKRDTPEMRAYKIQATSAKRIIEKKEWGTSGEFSSWMPDLSHEALILFTSGTTAQPKGARLTLQNLVVNAESIAQWLHITNTDRFLVVLPLHHINSTTFCLSALLAGASIAITPGYSNSHFFAQAAATGATLTSIVPSILFDQLGREKEFQGAYHSLRLSRIQLGSAPVVVSDAERFMQKFSIPLYQGYGQTETALRVTGVPMDLPEAIYVKLVKENAIGMPMSWATVEVADSDGVILGEREEGELIVKGDAVMSGYVGGESAFRNGYFLTGDIGCWKIVTGQRCFYLKGRAKEIIIKGGINISPVAVEDALKKISSDIDQVYVVGAPDDRYGEEVAAVIVWKEEVDQSAAMRTLKLLLIGGSPHLSAYEMPNYLAVTDAPVLPMTSTGKVQRAAIKKMFAGKFEPLHTLARTTTHQFMLITEHSPFARASRELYNHCWQPLTKDPEVYGAFLREQMTIGAIDASGVLVGQITISRKDSKLTCISICSANFKPKPIPAVQKPPTLEEVQTYIKEGHDPVMDFHKKLGAELIEIIPNGRPEDTSSLGYTVLLKYPAGLTTLTPAAPVSQQLIELARLLGNDLHLEVYALSRPGGLAAYLSGK